MTEESIYKRYERGFHIDSPPDELCYWFIFYRGRLLVTPDNLRIPYVKTPEELNLSPVRTQYLGKLEGKHCYSAEIVQDANPPENLEFLDLRTAYGVLDEDVYHIAGKATQIVAWDQTHQYCGRCGNATEYVPGERAKKCPVCGFMSFPRLSPAVITAVLKDDKILLTKYAAFRGNMHTIIAGFVEPGETLEECIRREVFEEVGVHVKNIRYFSSQPWPFPNSLMIGFLADYAGGEITIDEHEISHADWYSADDMPEIPPELSIARKIINWFIDKHKSPGPAQ